MRRHVIALAALTVLAVAPACRQKTEMPPPPQTATAAPRDTTVVPPPPAIVGVWTIVAHHIPDVSGMTASQADGWIGRSIRLSASEVISEGARCGRPSYTRITLDRDDFLQGDFNLPAGAIMRLAAVDNVGMIDVTCAGTPLQALGRLIIEVDANHILSPWDGVFFELERDHDFRAMGQEPSWTLDIVKAREIRLSRPGHEDVITPPAAARPDESTGVTTYHAATHANDLLVVIEPAPCEIHGRKFEATVKITLNGQHYRGCGGRLR